MDNIVSELNTVLKGEQMAIDSYGRYIEEVKDDEIKSELFSIQQDHKRHAGLLAERIQSLGGKPERSTGIAGVMAGAKQVVQGIIKDDTDILKTAYDGEDKGIGMTEEVIKGDLDKVSSELVQSILTVDHDHLKSMAKLIGRRENGE